MKFCFKFVIIKLLVLYIFIESSVSKSTCPKICICDKFNGLLRATCSNYKIVDVNVGAPKSIRIYDLSNSSIKQLEDYTFSKLSYTSLEEINLSQNSISWIGLHAFAKLNNLRILNLANNHLEEIAYDLFYYNPKLISLNISGNKFLKFSTIPFLIHKNLQVLNMSSSRISYLPPNIFNELPNLKELDLYGNYLKKISVSIIEPLTKLKQINLQNNYWTCNTEFNEFENWLETRKIVHHYQCKPIVKFERLQNFEDIKTESQDKNDELSSREENENEISSREEIDEFSLYEDNSDELCPPSEPNKNDNKENMFTDYTFLMLYNERVPSTISLLIGLQMGIVFGILGTYCWMGKLYKCKPIRLTNHRRLRRMRRQELIAHQQLLSWNNTSFDENYMTPPTLRRSALNTFNARPLNIIENQNSTSNLSCEIDIPVTSTAANTIPGPGRPETPPPTYKDCLKDSVIRTGNN